MNAWVIVNRNSGDYLIEGFTDVRMWGDLQYALRFESQADAEGAMFDLFTPEELANDDEFTIYAQEIL